MGRELCWVSKGGEPEQEIIVLLCFTAAMTCVTVEKKEKGKTEIKEGAGGV